MWKPTPVEPARAEALGPRLEQAARRPQPIPGHSMWVPTPGPLELAEALWQRLELAARQWQVFPGLWMQTREQAPVPSEWARVEAAETQTEQGVRLPRSYWGVLL